MWRVILSVAAVIFDGLMLVVMLLGFIGLTTETGQTDASHVTAHTAEAGNALPGLIMILAITVGALLNIAAIAFGARLPRKVVADPADTAGIFG